MSALKALPVAVGSIARNPIVVVPAALLALLSTANVAVQFGPRSIALVLALAQLLVALAQFLVVPFVAAGLYGLLREARTGSASSSTFWSAGRQYFLSVLAATLVVGVLFGVLAFVVAIGVLLGIGIDPLVAIANGTPPLTAIGTGGIVAVAVGALFLLVVQLFLQFADVAVVLADTDFADGIARSVRMVRRNLLGAIGFGVINWTVGLAMSLPVLWFVLPRLGDLPTGSPDALQTSFVDLGTDPVLLALLFVSSLVSTTFAYAYKTAFYAAIDPDVDGGGPGTDDDPAPVASTAD